MVENGTIVSLQDISVRAGATHILRNVILNVQPGEAVGVFGANGAGKTTLLRLLATLLKPASGSGVVLGADLNNDERYEVRHRIGYIGHVPGLYPEMTLDENLSFIATAMGIDGAAVASSLAAVGLAGAADRRAEVCSHGMQRRAEFARILMAQPEFLLLDEPHSALDGSAVDLVDDLVRQTIEAGGAAVLVSHDRSRVDDLATFSVEIAGGTLS
ncbi:MAG: heme ABC exporter ATP-binding protein CcmA [Actinomycetia bacterium]|nr:heme ABC exporter ATP-binding protein CcmA [Actinomycetes bacterium]